MIEFARMWLGIAALVLAAAAPAAEPEPAPEPESVNVSAITPGLGDMPGPTDVVFVRYRGMLEDGTVFDQSRDLALPPEAQALLPEGRPLPLADMIAGFQEGIVQMQKGGKYRLLIPSDKAYGPEGRVDQRTGEQKIPPNADLIFEIELIDFLSSEEFERRAALIDAILSPPVSVTTIAPGLGSNPGPADMVFVRYRGLLQDGTLFDESKDVPLPPAAQGLFPEGTPMPLDGVIPGFQEGIVQMQKGGKYRLLIPSSKAYGPDGVIDRRTGLQTIPPNADLTFEIELIDFMSMEEVYRRSDLYEQALQASQEAAAAGEGAGVE